ncbi:unnamed protein product [Cyclocybe aegerita]|uniref:Zn(2)-C6 fungal-type domain-containing protein n=1 Tax=Cyclocybe aegerita TaxID=1973307 RepID=A0A8S0X7P9_CYCAE|nr:unnamed protein product [Cyclocybe aegerita]
MDTSRTPLSPGGGKRRRESFSGEQLPVVPSSHPPPQQQTSLPSIRQLHPYLPPSSSSTIGMAQAGSSDSTAYGYPSTSHYALHPGQMDTSTAHAYGASQRDPGIFGAGESEADELDQHSPPKKKRRRQALSCTECKRRKIKCDRTQPCTPCTRRGEEAGCQWHIVEPVEKYATKAEFDELKARFEQLAALVQRLLPAATAVPSPYYPMGMQTSISGVMSEAVSTYNPGTSGTMSYTTMMHPPPPPQQAYGPHQTQHHMDASQAPSVPPNRYMKPEGVQSPTTRHLQPSSLPTSTSPIIPTSVQSPSLSRHRGVLEGSSPTVAAAVAKSSPLSLASITSPYHPEHTQMQPKNYHAQTLMLGERLRPGSEDPTNTSAKMRGCSEVVAQAEAAAGLVEAQVTLRRCISTAPRRRVFRRRPSTSSQGRRGGSVIRHHARLL